MRTQIDVGVLGYGGLTTMTSEFYYEVDDDAPHVTGTCSVRGRWARSGSVTPYRPQQPEVASPDQGVGSHGPPRSYNPTARTDVGRTPSRTLLHSASAPSGASPARRRGCSGGCESAALLGTRCPT